MGETETRGIRPLRGNHTAFESNMQVFETDRHILTSRPQAIKYGLSLAEQERQRAEQERRVLLDRIASLTSQLEDAQAARRRLQEEWAREDSDRHRKGQRELPAAAGEPAAGAFWWPRAARRWSRG